MGKTSIEWTQQTWNPVRGCSRISPGCQNCYAERMAARNLPGMCSPTTGKPFAHFPIVSGAKPAGPRWTGRVGLIPEMLEIPLRRRKPTTWFVNSMSDLFHEWLPDEVIDRVFAVMALCPQHTFQVLTKRAERMQHWFEGEGRTRPREEGVFNRAGGLSAIWQLPGPVTWPLPNVHLGVSCEDQQRADERIPLLLATPAAVRFVSLEPLLGPITLAQSGLEIRIRDLDAPIETNIHGVIVGGESGPGARPMHPEWPLAIRDQCQAAGVSFFFKQWGEWGMRGPGMPDRGPMIRLTRNGRDGSDLACAEDGGDVWMQRVGKQAAGRLLDGREWNDLPEVRA